MWSQSSRARASRIFATLSQAASVGSFIWGAAPLLAPLLAALLAYLLGHSWILAFAAGAMSMFAVLVLILMYPLRSTLRKILYGFRYRSVEITLEIDGDGRRRHRRLSTFRARIIRTGIRQLPDRYCCPGPTTDVAESDGAPSHTPKVVGGDAFILGPVFDQIDEHWNYHMDLGGSLSAGTDREIHLAQHLDFSKVGYEPRLQRTILDPTDHLVLVMRFPPSSWPVNVEGEEVFPGNRIRSVPVTTDDLHREVRMEVTKPRFGSIYRIRWSRAIQISVPFQSWPEASALNVPVADRSPFSKAPSNQ